MDYEKKYKEALERAKNVLNGKATDREPGTSIPEYIFPELKESEDERIRKELLEHCKNQAKPYIDTGNECQQIQSWIAWLEKHKPTTNVQNLTWEDIEKIGEFINTVQNENPNGIGAECLYTDVLERFLDGKQTKQKVINETDEEIVEQKPDDKVKPKFKQGEWIVWKDKYYKVNYNGCGYELFDQNGLSTSWDYKTIEDNAHLWAIEDARDGDVFVGSGMERNVTLMFRGIGNAEWDDVIDYHCYYDYHRKEFIVQKDLEYWGNTENNQLKPATKEQRDLLFQKMNEAGYMWDAENKKLKKEEEVDNPHNYLYGEQNLAWTEEDEYLLGETIQHLEELIRIDKAKHCACDVQYYQRDIDWLKTLKERMKGE